MPRLALLDAKVARREDDVLHLGDEALEEGGGRHGALGDADGLEELGVGEEGEGEGRVEEEVEATQAGGLIEMEAPTQANES